MRIAVKVTPNARKNEIRQEGDVLKVYLSAPALDGKANDALRSFLAEHYQVRLSAIEIVKGLKSRHKIVNIETI